MQRVRAQQHKLVGKVGRKYRLLACPNCDNELIAERSAIFDSVKSKVRECDNQRMQKSGGEGRLPVVGG